MEPRPTLDIYLRHRELLLVVISSKSYRRLSPSTYEKFICSQFPVVIKKISKDKNFIEMLRGSNQETNTSTEKVCTTLSRLEAQFDKKHTEDPSQNEVDSLKSSKKRTKVEDGATDSLVKEEDQVVVSDGEGDEEREEEEEGEEVGEELAGDDEIAAGATKISKPSNYDVLFGKSKRYNLM
jgi:hypothetical protein